MSKEFEKALEESHFFVDFECDRDKILRKDSDGNYIMNRVRDYYYFWESAKQSNHKKHLLEREEWCSKAWRGWDDSLYDIYGRITSGEL